jgi:hypothetical protein
MLFGKLRQRSVTFRYRDAAISYHIAPSLREQDGQDNQERSSNDDQQPER